MSITSNVLPTGSSVSPLPKQQKASLDMSGLIRPSFHIPTFRLPEIHVIPKNTITHRSIDSDTNDNTNDTNKDNKDKDKPVIEWTPQDEHSLQVAHLDVLTYMEVYQLYYDNLRMKNKAFRVPIITLSAVTSGASFSFAAMPVTWGNYYHIMIGVISLMVTILSGLEGHFKIPFLTSQAEGVISALLKLSQHTSKLIRIRPEKRTCSPIDELNFVYDTMGEVIQQSGVVVPAYFISRIQHNIEGIVFAKMLARNDPLAAHLARIRQQIDVFSNTKQPYKYIKTPQQLYHDIIGWGTKKLHFPTMNTRPLRHSEVAGEEHV